MTYISAIFVADSMGLCLSIIFESQTF